VALAVAAAAIAAARGLAAWRNAAEPSADALRHVLAGRRGGAVTVAGVVTATCAVAIAAGVILLPARAGPAHAGGPYVLGAGATGWTAGGGAVAAIDGRATDAAVLAGLRTRDVDHLDVLVVRTRAPAAATVVATLRRRWPGLTVVAPSGAPVPGAVSPPAGSSLTAGSLHLTVLGGGDGRLDVRVESVGRAPPARAPPAGPAPSLPSSRSTSRRPATCRYAASSSSATSSQSTSAVPAHEALAWVSSSDATIAAS
jgi:hypothetical protein